jgi:hypothetical protein
MFKKIILSLALLVSCKGMAASAGHLYTEFTATNGRTLRVRPISLVDFDNPTIMEGFNKDLIPNRKARCENNEAGLFVVESRDGEVLGRIAAGGMPLGFAPGNPTSDADKMRLKTILSFYAGLVKASGQEIKPTLVENVLHINPEILALTVAWMETPENTPGLFSTISAQEAIVGLVKTQGTKISQNGKVSPAGIPSICVSITTLEDLMPTDSTQVYPGLPYYDASGKFGGLRNVVVTRMSDDVTLPKPGDEYPIIDFSSFFDK